MRISAHSRAVLNVRPSQLKCYNAMHTIVFPFPSILFQFPSHSNPTVGRIPILTIILRDPWDSGLSHSHAHLAPLQTDFTDTRTALRLFFCFSFFLVFS